MKDQIVAEVRKHRLAHTRKFKGDLSAICDDLVRIERKSGHKIVRYAPKRLATDSLTAYGQIKSVAVPNYPISACGREERSRSLSWWSAAEPRPVQRNVMLAVFFYTYEN